jgi:hypothetical protein
MKINEIIKPANTAKTRFEIFAFEISWDESWSSKTIIEDNKVPDAPKVNPLAIKLKHIEREKKYHGLLFI